MWVSTSKTNLGGDHIAVFNFALRLHEQSHKKKQLPGKTGTNKLYRSPQVALQVQPDRSPKMGNCFQIGGVPLSKTPSLNMDQAGSATVQLNPVFSSTTD